MMLCRRSSAGARAGELQPSVERRRDTASASASLPPSTMSLPEKQTWPATRSRAESATELAPRRQMSHLTGR